jgi:hypothetical protein
VDSRELAQASGNGFNLSFLGEGSLECPEGQVTDIVCAEYGDAPCNNPTQECARYEDQCVEFERNCDRWEETCEEETRYCDDWRQRCDREETVCTKYEETNNCLNIHDLEVGTGSLGDQGMTWPRLPL